MARRRCKGKTKKGTRCRAAPLKGGDYCIAHGTRKDKVSQGFGGPQPGSGRPANPRVVDVMRERVEEKIDEVLAPYFGALEGAMVHTVYMGDLEVTDHPDLGARIMAAEKLLDRVYGKPAQRVIHAGDEESPIHLVDELGDPKVKEAMFEALRRVDAARGS